MLVIYRTSPDGSGYTKMKPDYINEINCLKNFIGYFLEHNFNMYLDGRPRKSDRPIFLLLADVAYFKGDKQRERDYLNQLYAYVSPLSLKIINQGSGAKAFNLSLDIALDLPDDEIVYFVENDYLHKRNSYKVLQEGLTLASYVSLYDHKDKYVDGYNPFVTNNSEFTKVFVTESTHWKYTNSTTGTWATKVKYLKEDELILRQHTLENDYNDFGMFMSLKGNHNRNLVTPIPGYATHGETAFLSPLVKWEEYII